MDIAIEKKHPKLRKYKYPIIGGAVLLALLVYLLTVGVGARRLRYDAENLRITEVKRGAFQEYVETEGFAQPILTLKITTSEGGTVERIVADPGAMLREGDTILVLSNPELLRTIEDERDNLEKQQVSYREKMIQMEKGSSELKRNALRTTYDLDKLSKKHALDLEEYNIGVISKAQLEMAVDEYNFTRRNTELLLQELHNDSLAGIIQAELMASDLRREGLKYSRSRERLDDLVVRAPVSGQLGYISVIPGERVGVGASLGDIRVVDNMKVSIKVSEYYMERIQIGAPASIVSGDEKIPMVVARVNPEITSDRNFEVDLFFAGGKPENIVLGKAYRVQLELDQPIEALVMDKGNFYQYTGGRWVFKLDASGNKAKRAEITIGRQNTRQYEILEGLSPGDRVVISGYENFGNAQELILK